MVTFKESNEERVNYVENSNNHEEKDNVKGMEIRFKEVMEERIKNELWRKSLSFRTKDDKTPLYQGITLSVILSHQIYREKTVKF